MIRNRILTRAILGIALGLPLVFTESYSSVAQQLTSSVAGSRNQITGIRLVPTGDRLKLEIDTAGGARPQVFFTQQGNAWVGDITNAELKTTDSTRQEKPVPGVKLLEATQLDKTSVRVQIVGETQAPQGLLAERTSSRLVFDFNSMTAAPLVASKPIDQPAPVSPPTDSTVATAPSQSPIPLGRPLTTDAVVPIRPAPPLAAVPASPIKPLPTLKSSETGLAATVVPPASSKPALLTPPKTPVVVGKTVAPSPVVAAPAKPSPTLPTTAQSSVVPSVAQLSQPPVPPRAVTPKGSQFATRAIAPPASDIATSDLVIPQNTVDLGSTRNISLTLRNAPVGDVLSLLIRRAGLNIVLNDVPTGDPEGVVSLDVKESPLQETFDFILRLKGLQAIRREQTVFIGRTLPGIDQQIVRNYRINQAATEEAVTFLQSLAAEGGPLVGAQFVPDTRTNSITAIATNNQQSVIAAQLAQLDVREWQVLLDVQVFQLSEGTSQLQNPFDLGATSGNFAFSTPGFPDGLGLPNPGGVIFSSLSDFTSNIAARLNNQTSPFSKVLSNPKIICAQGEDCKVDVGTSVVTNVTSSTDPATGVTTQTLVFETAGVILELEKTRVDGNGFVSFDSFKPSVNSPDSTFTLTNGTQISRLAKRSVELGKVRFRDGETYVLSGLIQDTDQTTVTKVPILGDIPLLGNLFRQESSAKLRTETVFLITPYILRDGVRSGVNVSSAPSALPTIATTTRTP